MTEPTTQALIVAEPDALQLQADFLDTLPGSLGDDPEIEMALAKLVRKAEAEAAATARADADRFETKYLAAAKQRDTLAAENAALREALCNCGGPSQGAEASGHAEWCALTKGGFLANPDAEKWLAEHDEWVRHDAFLDGGHTAVADWLASPDAERRLAAALYVLFVTGEWVTGSIFSPDERRRLAAELVRVMARQPADNQPAGDFFDGLSDEQVAGLSEPAEPVE